MAVVRDGTFGSAMKTILKSDTLVVDLETTGVKPYQGDQLCGVAVAAPKSDGDLETFYFPFRHAGGQNLSKDQLRILMESTSDPDKLYIGHNYGFDMKFMAQDGARFPEQIRDTMLGMHVLNENEHSFALKALGDKYLGDGASDEQKKLKDQLQLWGWSVAEMWRAPPSMVAPYAEQDVRLTWNLHCWMVPRLEKQELSELYAEVSAYGLLIARMEHLGVRINAPMVDKYANEAMKQEMRYTTKIRQAAGIPINPGSPKQLGNWLGLSSTKAEILEDLADSNPNIDLVFKYRQWSKVRTTYYETFLRERDQNDNIHCSFKVHGTVSGRLSCSGPNLQAIPRASDIYKVKDTIVPRPGYTFVEADYSQAEIRVGSHYAQEKNMIRLLVDGVDIHTATAEKLKIDRSYAKRINFGVVYGIGKVSLAQKLKISEDQAAEFLHRYHGEYPGFRLLYQRAEMLAKSRRYIRMYTGRLRHFNTPNAEHHKASSNLIQGSVAEMVRVAMLRIDRELRRDDVRIILQVHDSVIMEIRTEVLDENIRAVKAIMEEQPWCTVPLPVDVKAGLSWGLAKDYEL